MCDIEVTPESIETDLGHGEGETKWSLGYAQAFCAVHLESCLFESVGFVDVPGGFVYATMQTRGQQADAQFLGWETGHWLANCR